MMNTSLTQSQQYQAVHEQVGWLRLDSRTLLEVGGADRATFLHNLCTNDVKKLQPGQGCEAFITNVQGRILGHAMIFRESDSIVMETASGQAEILLGHFDRYLIREDVVLNDRTAQWRQLLLVGPHARGLLQGLGVDSAWQMMEHRELTWAGTTVRIRRVPLLAVDSFLVQFNGTDVEAVVQSLLEHGAQEFAEAVFEICRIESGFPLYGQDITSTNLPQEVGRDEQAISFTKGCYLGQETVARIDAMGHVNRHFVGLQFAEDADPVIGTELQHQDKVVGRVTSVCASPQLGTPLGLGCVRREAATPGCELDSVAGAAKVVQLPV